MRRLDRHAIGIRKHHVVGYVWSVLPSFDPHEVLLYGSMGRGWAPTRGSAVIYGFRFLRSLGWGTTSLTTRISYKELSTYKSYGWNVYEVQG